MENIAGKKFSNSKEMKDDRGGFGKFSRGGSRGRARGDSRGRSRGGRARGGSRGGSRGSFQGGSREGFRGGPRGRSGGASRGGFRGSSRGEFRGSSRGGFRGSARGGFRGSSRGGFQVGSHDGSEGEVRGSSRGFRGSSRGGFRGSSRGGFQVGSHDGSEGEVRGSSRGFRGSFRGRSQRGSRAGLRGSSRGGRGHGGQGHITNGSPRKQNDIEAQAKDSNSLKRKREVSEEQSSIPVKKSNLKLRPQDVRKKLKLLPEETKKAILITNLPQNAENYLNDLQDFVVSKVGPVKVITFHKLTFTRSAYISAICVFEEFSDMKLATEKLHGQLFHNRHLLVQEFKISVYDTHHTSKNCVCVLNLPEKTKEEDLWLYFESCGNLGMIHINRNSNSGAPIEAIVNFKESDSVAEALKLNGGLILGSAIEVYHLKREFSVLVTNLDRQTKYQELKDFLGSTNIVYLTFGPKKKHEQKRALVFFKDEEGHANALKLDGNDFNSSKISIRASVESLSVEVHDVFLPLLSSETSAADLAKSLKEFGEVTNIALRYRQGISRVSFKTVEQVQAILSASKFSLNGESVFVCSSFQKALKLKKKKSKISDLATTASIQKKSGIAGVKANGEASPKNKIKSDKTSKVQSLVVSSKIKKEKMDHKNVMKSEQETDSEDDDQNNEDESDDEKVDIKQEPDGEDDDQNNEDESDDEEVDIKREPDSEDDDQNNEEDQSDEEKPSSISGEDEETSELEVGRGETETSDVETDEEQKVVSKPPASKKAKVQIKSKIPSHTMSWKNGKNTRKTSNKR